MKIRLQPLTTRIANYLAVSWQPVVLYGGLFAAFAVLLFWRLGTLLPGYTQAEAQTFQSSTSLRGIFDQPVDAPFTLITYGLSYLSAHSYLFTRITAIIFGLATLAAFCWLAQYWFGRRTALFATILFGTSAWFLHTARLGTPDILLFGVLALIACSVWLKRTNSRVALLFCFAIASGLLYVPGMIWIVAIGTIFYWRTIRNAFRRELWLVSVGVFMILSALLPIAWAIYRTPELWKTFLGLPAVGWPNWSAVAHNLYEIPASFFVRFFDATPDIWLGKLPILDVFSMAMVFIGGYVCIKHRRLTRVKLIGFALLVGLVLASLEGAVSISILVPFIYLVVAAGLGYIIEQWLKVFPRNPIPRFLAIGLISVAVLAASGYSLRHYFSAWPENRDTRAVYSVNEIKLSDTIKE